MDAVGLAGSGTVAEHEVRRLLLVAERQEWCSLVRSSGLPSYLVARSRRWCRLCKGAACQSWRCSPGVQDGAPGMVSVFSTLWFDSGYMFNGRLWTNFSIFYVAANLNPEAVLLHLV